MAKYRSHKRKIDKDRQLAGWRSALNNPSTTSAGRSHARKQLLMRGHVGDALFSTSINTRIRRMLGLRAKSHG
ncbi:hypothetical protein IE81DRAFT_318359 [Ceraceosorus guamensis]|uniref:Uncharacterized protein n=1 Tax=Ceraceosorus guamensis TaxID=1522189 RepID=A0A316VUF6_9BASI|nr:hypothetical protein IE81DRAFT_318359 [Ceraceosorus guamensis]PWN39145.1 hypothetical protein IE81DRAFT_318359 [Ceraceosorus guamensis]